MRYFIIFFLFLFGCQNNYQIKNTKQGAIETKITHLVDAYWKPISSNKDRTIKEFRITKQILVKGIFRHADFEQVLTLDLKETAAELCGGSEYIKEMNIEYSENENTRIIIGSSKTPPPPEFDFFFRVFTLLVCQ